MESLKQSYLRIEFLSLTVNGALGRSNTYSESATDAEKSKFRDSLCMELLKCEKLYLKRVSEADHLKSIIDLSTTLSQRFSPCLKGGCFRIGIAQKALNLYLKYLWCIGIIEEPPHCPFDYNIIKKIPGYKGDSWTSINSIADYKELVSEAKKVAGEKTLSLWELSLWNEYKNVPAETKMTYNSNIVETTLGWSRLATKFHDRLSEIMSQKKNRILSSAEIKSIINGDSELNKDAQWILPSDHCINSNNKGSCQCALTNQAIFEKIARGKYLVL